MSSVSRSRPVLIPTLAGLCILFTATAFAQSSAEVNAGVQYNFANPGARSLALGGAFIGLADDATAAYTNPAGLTILQKPELSAEFRQNRYRNEFVDSGHTAIGGATATVTGNGVDTVSGLQTGQATNSVSDLNFLSFVYPHERWSLAFYGHELAKFKADFRAHGVFYNAPGFVDPGRFFPTTNTLDLQVRNYATSLGIKVTDSVSIGVGVNYLKFNLDSLTNRFGFQGNKYTAADYNRLLNFQAQQGTGHRFTYTAGLMARPSEKVSIGAVYRKGAKFNVTAGTFDAVDPTNQLIATGQFRVPAFMGAGIAMRPVAQLLISADVNRVNYSETAKGWAPLFGEDPQLYHARNATELHLGLEYGLTQISRPLFLRIGGWHDPAHRVTYEDPNNGDLLLFQPGHSATHVTGGLGLVFGPAFELNAGADVSKQYRTISISFVTRR
jgi:long-chain fatty acid transport protein